MVVASATSAVNSRTRPSIAIAAALGITTAPAASSARTEAYARNRQLVEGKRVRLELDVQARDRYGRLLAHVWGSEESLEGMNAFLENRKPDFQRFRMRNKRALERYLDGCARNLNAPPSMR